MRIAFAGTPEFASAALARLPGAGHEVVLVLTQPDRPAGRGMKLQESPVKQLAQSHRWPVAQPRSLRLDGKYPNDAAQARATLLDAHPDVMVVAAYGLILPQWVLDLPRHGCINIHGSLLPRWRGAAPIHRAIEAGDAQTGITLMRMDAGLDTGDLLSAQAIAITADDTTASLHDRLAELGGRMLVDTLAQLEQDGALTATPQPAAGVTYAQKVDKHEAVLDWSHSAELLARRVRAFNPFPVANTTLLGEVVKVWAATARDHDGQQAAPGTVLRADERGLVIAAQGSTLTTTQLQRAGGKRLAVADFLRGFPVPVGSVAGAALASSVGAESSP